MAIISGKCMAVSVKKWFFDRKFADISQLFINFANKQTNKCHENRVSDTLSHRLGRKC